MLRKNVEEQASPVHQSYNDSDWFPLFLIERVEYGKIDSSQWCATVSKWSVPSNTQQRCVKFGVRWFVSFAKIWRSVLEAP
jgi:hypothetical protein